MANPLNLPTKCATIEDWKLCYTEASPSLNTLRRAFTALLCWAFEHPQNMDGFEEALGCLTWDKDNAITELTIQPGSAIDPGDTENVPGIIVSCGKDGVRYTRPYNDALSALSPDTSAGTLTYIAEVNVEVLCRNNDADIACVMADYVMLFLSAVGPLLRRTFRWFLDYTPVSQTEPVSVSKSESDPTARWYETTVTFKIEYSYDISIFEESQRLKTAAVYVNAAQ